MSNQYRARRTASFDSWLTFFLALGMNAANARQAACKAMGV